MVFIISETSFPLTSSDSPFEQRSLAVSTATSIVLSSSIVFFLNLLRLPRRPAIQLLHIVPDGDLPAFNYFAEDAFAGHYAVAYLVVNDAMAMALFAYFRDFEDGCGA
jgi:hypothetical protein